jgi:hypothetical protein
VFGVKSAHFYPILFGETFLKIVTSNNLVTLETQHSRCKWYSLLYCRLSKCRNPNYRYENVDITN